ncbi:MAG: trypsin-like peptidase domain-containing protein [Planctomycetia bacterium]|nr:trypsin-like peptidase domain-containing protein [Planctomycetia bacterium]
MVAVFMTLSVAILNPNDGNQNDRSTQDGSVTRRHNDSSFSFLWNVFGSSEDENLVARRIAPKVEIMPVSNPVSYDADATRRSPVSTHYAPPVDSVSQPEDVATATSGVGSNAQVATVANSSATTAGFSDYQVAAPTALPARTDAQSAVRAENLKSEALVNANNMSSRAYAPGANPLRGNNKIKLESYVANDQQKAEVERALSRFTPEKPLLPQPQTSASASATGVRSTSFESNEQFDILEANNRARRQAYDIAKRSVLPIIVSDVQLESGQKGTSVGSGLLASSDKEVYLLTNAHIVQNAPYEKISIILPNSEKISPDAVYSCEDFDIAVLLLDSSKLPQDGSVTTCRWAVDNALQVSDEVFTVGSPLGLESSFVFGYVSGLGRRRSDLDSNPQNNLPIYIQVDSSINSGNSGGPLFNVRSEVVGIVCHTAAKYGLPLGVGFAIPVDVAVRVADSLIENKGWNRFRLGVDLCPTTLADLRGVDATVPVGVKVTSVAKGSVASRLGFKVNDIVLIYNGVKVQDDAHLRHMIALSNKNEPLHINVLRNGQMVELSSENLVRPVTYAPR